MGLYVIGVFAGGQILSVVSKVNEVFASPVRKSWKNIHTNLITASLYTRVFVLTANSVSKPVVKPTMCRRVGIDPGF